MAKKTVWIVMSKDSKFIWGVWREYKNIPNKYVLFAKYCNYYSDYIVKEVEIEDE